MGHVELLSVDDKKVVLGTVSTVLFTATVSYTLQHISSLVIQICELGLRSEAMPQRRKERSNAQPGFQHRWLCLGVVACPCCAHLPAHSPPPNVWQLSLEKEY